MSHADPVPQRDLDLVAAIDLGSNSFHMIVASLQGGQLRIVDRLREPVRLAAGLDAQRRISAEAERRALACLERFGQRLRAVPPESTRVVGTNTLRRARNAREFLAAAESALGRPIEVISGIEEARLIYLGVAHSLSDDGVQRLVVDIGGGSTELIIGERFEARHLESLHMGCVSLTQEYFGQGITRRAWEKGSLAAHMELEVVSARFRELSWQRAIGASGTIRAIAAALKDAQWADYGVNLSGLRKLRDQLLKDGKVDPARFKSVSADRAEVFAAGAAILLAVFEALGLERMEVAEGALREGLLYDLMGRIQHEDVRGASVASFARRYHVDLAQAARVSATALDLLVQVAGQWSLEEEPYPQVLGWAAGLHEIGLDIAHSQYHKHGGYVLCHADLPGFSRQEQQVLAVLVRTHRRKFPLAEFKELPSRWQLPAQRLALLLRLAVLLHRSRSDEPLPRMDLKATEKGLRLRFPEGWLASHPLLQADLEQEAGYLGGAGIQLDFS